MMYRLNRSGWNTWYSKPTALNMSSYMYSQRMTKMAAILKLTHGWPAPVSRWRRTEYDVVSNLTRSAAICLDPSGIMFKWPLEKKPFSAADSHVLLMHIDPALLTHRSFNCKSHPDAAAYFCALATAVWVYAPSSWNYSLLLSVIVSYASALHSPAILINILLVSRFSL